MSCLVGNSAGRDSNRHATRRAAPRGFGPSDRPEAGCRGPTLEVALLVPLSGAAGLWGPSALACAQLAVEHWNSAGGQRGREVRLTVLDASDEAEALEAHLEDGLDAGAFDAVVGMHTSSVRQRALAAVGGRVPFVYTPLYEGGPMPPGVYAIGETPDTQLLPALSALSARHGLRRWYLLGNDYIWPRRSHRLAGQAIAGAGGEVVASRFEPLGRCDIGRAIDEVRRQRADAVLISLIGQDAIDFNRAFADAGLERSVVRLSCAIEENGLLGIGPNRTEGLYVASGYFAALPDDRNAAFRERYWTRFGERAPALNALGQSVYEGVSFLRGMLAGGRRDDASVDFDSVRGTRWRDNARKATPVWLAQAAGMRFEVMQQLPMR